jgi:hypothetical protein
MAAVVIGVISDTHGLLRPEAAHALREVGLILHAGDIGNPEVLTGLESIAPVVAVRGNNDKEAWADAIPETQTIEIGGVSLYMVHDIKTIGGDAAGKDVIIFGHSHKPLVEYRSEVMYLNPGSAGRRRFSLPVTVAILKITDAVPTAEIVELSI